MSRPVSKVLFVPTALAASVASAPAAVGPASADANPASGPDPNPLVWETPSQPAEPHRVGSPPMGGSASGVRIGPNLYSYVRQNPWTAFDPDGLKLKTNDPKRAKEALSKILAGKVSIDDDGYVSRVPDKEKDKFFDHNVDALINSDADYTLTFTEESRDGSYATDGEFLPKSDHRKTPEERGPFVPGGEAVIYLQYFKDGVSRVTYDSSEGKIKSSIEGVVAHELMRAYANLQLEDRNFVTNKQSDVRVTQRTNFVLTERLGKPRRKRYGEKSPVKNDKIEDLPYTGERYKEFIKLPVDKRREHITRNNLENLHTKDRK